MECLLCENGLEYYNGKVACIVCKTAAFAGLKVHTHHLCAGIRSQTVSASQ